MIVIIYEGVIGETKEPSEWAYVQIAQNTPDWLYGQPCVQLKYKILHSYPTTSGVFTQGLGTVADSLPWRPARLKLFSSYGSDHLGSFYKCHLF